ncbi:MAG: adenosine deaminase [Candidatus Eremiobacteraeota bacterium]|nr:adenosine deaminase [Candidatus Eremiobacteraeota bacterium]
MEVGNIHSQFISKKASPVKPGVSLKASGEAQEAPQHKDLVDIRQKPAREVMGKEDLRNFLGEIPKVDLHRHLEGSIEPKTLISIAKRKGLELPAYDEKGLKPYLQVTDQDKTLLDFLKKFDTIGKAFTDKDAIEEITYEAVKDANADNVKYAEFRFSPVYMASQYGLKEEDVMKGILDGVKKAKEDFDTDVKLIMIVERQMGVDHAAHVGKMAEQYMDKGVVALDLANDEFHFPPGPYAEVFQKAKDAGLNITVHAGEAGGADNVKVSINDLKADRIGHGVRTFEDPEVEKDVLNKGIPLEMCPTSNIQTGATKSLETHPFKRYYDKGIKVTINTDDPGVSDIVLSDDYYKIVDQFGFSLQDVENFVMNGVDAAFLPQDEKKAMKEKYGKEIAALEEKYLVAGTPATKTSSNKPGIPSDGA